MDRAGVKQVCLSLPAATLDHPFGDHHDAYRVGGKMFCMVGEQGGVSFKVSDIAYEVLTETGHAEVVQVVFNPQEISYGDLLKTFWENHDPTQGMRQGNDVGTTYRSAIYYLSDEQRAEAEASRDAYQQALSKAGRGDITTEIAPAGPFFFAEDYHQAYLAKNPGGYCGIGGTGVTCPIGVGVEA